MRITEKNLEARIAYLNKITGQPEAPFSRVDGNLIPHAGNYHLESVHGGYKLAQMCRNGSGSKDINYGGCITKRELYTWINAFINGVEYKEGIY